MSIRPAALLLPALLLSACYTPGGGFYPYSGGPKTYYSLQRRPVSIKLIDVRDNKVVFAMDVPTGKELVYQFLPGRGDNKVLRPDLMRYDIFPIGQETGTLSNSITVPSEWCRRVDVYYSDKIEYMEAPVTEESIRTDTVEDRPDWWSPEGGKVPKDQRGLSNYDG